MLTKNTVGTHMHAHVCVCMWREREKERERESGIDPHSHPVIVAIQRVLLAFLECNKYVL